MALGNIKFLVMDVDGTLTDGKIYMGQDGELFKAFHVKDGCGIKDILPVLGIRPIIITGRSSHIVENRCKELGITLLFQDVSDKALKLKEILTELSLKDGIVYSEQDVAFIGDDLPDLSCMRSVRDAGGITACPSDAAGCVKQAVNLVLGKRGGEGAVRELIDILTDKESIERRTVEVE